MQTQNICGHVPAIQAVKGKSIFENGYTMEHILSKGLKLMEDRLLANDENKRDTIMSRLSSWKGKSTDHSTTTTIDRLPFLR